MRFWFARQSDVPIREQLVTQVVLGILGNELQPGERLPSTRELARRFRLHPNTISAAYRELEKQRWVELRHGSGVYVRKEQPEERQSSNIALDQKIQSLFRTARELGCPLSEVRERLRHWLAMQPPDHFLLVEPDEELRAIVAAELRLSAKLPLKSTGLEALRAQEELSTAIVLALPSKSGKVRRLLPPNTECLTLKVRSVPTSLAKWLPSRAELLIGVASRWPEFLKTARTMLVAAGFSNESLVVRDARKRGWQKSMDAVAAVVCDCVTANELPPRVRAIVFHVLADEALHEVQAMEKYVSATLD